MKEINNCIKENDTDNVILNKLKELGTKLTGQENVQGETVADVLDFINSNYSVGGGSSGGNVDTGTGGSSEIKTYTFKLYNINSELNEDYEIKCINKTAFIDIQFMFLLGGLDFSNIDNNRIKIGTCTVTDNNNNNINTKSVIPVVYQLYTSNGAYNEKYNGNLEISYDETNVGTNIVELIINTEDVQMMKNIDKNSTIIELIGGGLFNDNVYIP